MEMEMEMEMEIPKANRKIRPLGVGSPRDKFVQKALHAILDAIFEPPVLAIFTRFPP